jgi:hypothetical protein
MAIKIYKFDYGMMDAELTFKVDTEIFTDKLAQETLDFFDWDDDYDIDENPIDEVMKKYAMMAITLGGFKSVNELGVIIEFEDLEGFGKIDGSLGITLTSFSGHEFDSSNLGVTILEKYK